MLCRRRADELMSKISFSVCLAGTSDLVHNNVSGGKGILDDVEYQMQIRL
jgi:hypothetical protein